MTEVVKRGQPAPQLEDGYTRIANELLDALLCTGLTSRQWAVVMTVIRKTYGYHKTRDNISLTQLANMTGMSRPNVSRTVNELVERGILTRTDAHGSMVLGIVKRYSLWGLPKQQQGLPKQQQPEGCQTGNGGCQDSNTKGVAKIATEVLPTWQQQGLPTWQHHIKENNKEKERKARAPKVDASATFVLPEWVNADAWAAWLEVRRQKRAPNTEKALRQNLAVLEAERAAGGNPTEVLNRSIASGWTGLFSRLRPRQIAVADARQQAIETGLWNGRMLTDTERYMLKTNPSYTPMTGAGG